MTKTQTQTNEPDLLGEGALQGKTSAPKTARKVQGGYTGGGGDKPKPPTTRSGVVAKFEQPTNMLAIIARIAADPAVNTDKMRAVIEIQRDTEAKQQFHDALIKMDAELPRINKDGKIELKGGKAIRFASFENLNKIIKPILRSYDFRLNFQPDVHPSGQGIVVHCHLTKGLYRESCMIPVSTAPASPAMNAQQSVGAAISYAKRYGAIALLNIETEAPDDRDTDATAPAKTITGPQAKLLLKAIDECGIEATRFMEKYRITAVHELPTALYDEAIKACKDYGAAKTAKQDAQ